MELMCERCDGVTIVLLVGAQLDASTAPDFQYSVTPVLDEHSQIVFDLSRLGFIDSSGLGALLSCLRQIHAKGGDLKLCGMSKPVRALFELVRMHKLFHIFDTPEEAVRAFQV